MRTEATLVSLGVTFIVVGFMGLSGCFERPGVTLPTPTPGPYPKLSPFPTMTQPHGAYTESPTSPGPRPGETATFTPSPVVLTATPSPSIIEVTATSSAIPTPTQISEHWTDIIGIYTPNMDMNIRSCTMVSDSCYTGKSVIKGERTPFYAMITIYSSGDIWLCLDSLQDENGNLASQCGELVAYYVKGTKYGSIEIVVPSGG